MKKLSFSLMLSIAIVVIFGSTQGVQAVETPLTDYSRAVMLENPTYYWNFNEAGATDVAQDVMRYETQGQLIPCVDATRVVGATTELGNAASLNDNATFWANLLGRGNLAGASAVELWVQSNDSTDTGYIANFLGNPVSGNTPGIIYGFNSSQMELFYATGGRTGIESSLQVTDNAWHHVVMAVYGNGTFGVANRIDIAVDGVVTTLANTVNSTQLNINGALSVGACFPSTVEAPSTYTTGDVATAVWDGFNGNVDELAVYDLSNMTEAEVAAKVATLAGHHALASNPTAITPFAAVPGTEISYDVIAGNVPYPSYADAGGELTDGLYNGNTLNVNNVGYQGSNGFVELEFDLSEVRTLDAIWVDYLGSGHRYGIDAPESALISYSEDGVNFTTMPLFEDFNNAPCDYNLNERKSQIDMGDVDARYVRIRFNNWDKEDEGGVKSNFVFLSEVQFMETATVPEPSTIALLICGFASLLIWRRRSR